MSNKLQNETICAMHDSMVEKVRDFAGLINSVARYCDANERPKLILSDAIMENINIRCNNATEKELLEFILKKIKGQA